MSWPNFYEARSTPTISWKGMGNAEGKRERRRKKEVIKIEEKKEEEEEMRKRIS